MKDVIYLLFELLTTLAKLLRPSGGRAVIAESLVLKQQQITTTDRGFLAEVPALSIVVFLEHILGYKNLMHLIGTIGNAQGTRSHKEAHQWVVS